MLTKFQMRQSNWDPCVFLETGPEPIYLALYVDDGLIFARNQKMIHSMITYLTKEFEMKLVTSNCLLGVQIERYLEDKTVFLHQKD